MEVIKHGNTYKEVECAKCGALLSYCKTDIKKKYQHEEYIGDGYFHYSYRQYIVCPECNCDIELSWIIDGKEQVK